MKSPFVSAINSISPNLNAYSQKEDFIEFCRNKHSSLFLHTFTVRKGDARKVQQQNNRTTHNQSLRETSTQVNRTAGSQARMAGSQTNKGNGSQTKGSTKRTRKQKQPVDRLGQAVVSLIFGIFGIILFVLSLVKLNYDSRYSYTTSPGTMVTMILAYIVNAVGFILGIRARRSTKGRGMAIAGITLTALPFVLMTLFIGGAIILTFFLFR
ncbi:hypothetical protein D3C77_407500 [compost metagenome]